MYRIKDWDLVFENNRTRELKHMAWVPVPNSFDGDGYTMIMERVDGAEIYGAWIACVNLASKCDPRGTLLRDGENPHNIDSISRMTRISKKSVEKMLRFCSESCKWLIPIKLQEGATLPQEGATISHDAAKKERKKEGKGKNQFTPPSFQEFKAYCISNGFGNIAERAFKTYDVANWHDSQGKPVLSWKQKLQAVWFRDENRQKPDTSYPGVRI